jgi:uncharacterized OB-fold protein
MEGEKDERQSKSTGRCSEKWGQKFVGLATANSNRIRRSDSMENRKQKLPAVKGWFTMDFERPNLIGTRCKSCGDYFFPKETSFCRNPNCSSVEFEEVYLSRRGSLWSFTLNCYKPPYPYMPSDPFVPYGIAAVELNEEKMMVLGQIVHGFDYKKLKVGMEMELVLDKLYEDKDCEYMVWKWRPTFSENS